MIREFKFRFWNLDSQEMITDVQSYLYLYLRGVNSTIPNPPNNIIPMQFTGLKDKKGNEVYEGDILEFEYGELKATFPVTFQNGYFGLYRNEKEKPVLLAAYIANCVVVGNIYQNLATYIDNSAGELNTSEIRR